MPAVPWDRPGSNAPARSHPGRFPARAADWLWLPTVLAGSNLVAPWADPSFMIGCSDRIAEEQLADGNDALAEQVVHRHLGDQAQTVSVVVHVRVVSIPATLFTKQASYIVLTRRQRRQIANRVLSHK